MPRPLAFLAALLLALPLASTPAPPADAQEPAGATLSLPPLHNNGGVFVLADGVPCLFVALHTSERSDVRLGSGDQASACSTAGAEISFVGASGNARSVRLVFEPGALLRVANWPPEPLSDPEPPTEHPRLKDEYERLVGCYGLLQGFPDHEGLALAVVGDGFPRCPDGEPAPQFRFNLARATCPASLEIAAIHLAPSEEVEYRVARVDRSGIDVQRTTANASGIIRGSTPIRCKSAGAYRVDVVRVETSVLLATVMVETTIDYSATLDDPAPDALPSQGPADPNSAPNGTILTDTAPPPPATSPIETPRTDATAAARSVAASVVASVVLALGAAAALEVAARRRGRSQP